MVRSNGTAISAAATSLDFIEGTNVTIRATNAAGVVTVQINASGGGSVDPTNAVLANIIETGAITNLNANQFSGTTITSIKSGALLSNTVNEGVTIFNGDSSNRANLIVKGAVNPKFRITSVSPPQVLQLSSTAISTDAGGGQAYITISPEDYPTLRINTNSLESINPGYDLGVLGTPWAYAYVNTNRNKGIHLFGGQAASSLLRLDSGTNIATVTIGSGLSFDGTTLTASAGGALTTNANQFGASVTLTIASGALLTNLQVRGIDPLGLTASRALALNASGDITNGATTAAELEFVNGVTSAIQTQLNGKQNGQTNSSQFGASTVLTLADRLSVTNLNSYGTGAVFFGHLTVGTNVTAQSFIGSGTGTPYLLLSSPNGASFGITVDTNRTAQTSNTFNFTSVAANDVIKMHSSSAGIVVWTNMPASRVTPVVVAGVGTPSTNFTWLSTQQEISLTTTANVFIASVTGFDTASVDYWTCVVTNGSGTNRTLGFSAGTNNWRFNGVYGTNAPSVITNNTRIEISGRQHGTNTQVVYGYTPWP